MRECGGCTLCCKIPRIDEVVKASNEWCRHCDIGKGCKIYGTRPKVCQDFKCWWLEHEEMPEEMRPDKVHMYGAGKPEDEIVKVRVDTDYQWAWKGSPVVGYFREAGKHVLVVVGN